MNVQAWEGVCHGKNCIVGAKWHNINLKRFTTARSHRIGAHTDTDHIRPGGDGSWGWRCPRHFVPGRLRSDSTELAEVLRRDRRRWLRKPLTVGRAVGLRRAQSSRFAESGYDRTVPPGHFPTGLS